MRAAHRIDSKNCRNCSEQLPQVIRYRPEDPSNGTYTRSQRCLRPLHRLESEGTINLVRRQRQRLHQSKSNIVASAHTLYARTIEVAMQGSLQNADWEDYKNNGKYYKLRNDARINFYHARSYSRCLVTLICAKWLPLKGVLGQALWHTGEALLARDCSAKHQNLGCLSLSM